MLVNCFTLKSVLVVFTMFYYFKSDLKKSFEISNYNTNLCEIIFHVNSKILICFNSSFGPTYNVCETTILEQFTNYSDR